MNCTALVYYDLWMTVTVGCVILPIVL